MRIQHNIMAMNAYRNFANNTSALSKNLEKLSSGYKINRAGDDAAGLAISEKMRAQITGLNRAQANAKSGINLVQTAEGAMQEIHSMLNRMVDLANQSANGTYDSEVDRVQLQKEVSQLKDEIDRIADSANFNGIKLLDGSLASNEVEALVADGKEVQDMILSANGGTLTEIPAHGAGLKDIAFTDLDDAKFDAFEITYTNADGVEKTLTLAEKAADAAGKGADIASGIKAALENGTLEITTTGANGKEDLAEFLETFDITANAAGDKLSITAKDPNSKATVTSIKQGSNADAADQAIGALSNVTATAVKAEPPTATIAITAGAGDEASITVGNKTYVTDAAGDEAAKAKDLLAQLKKDGYNVELDPNDANKQTIKFNDMTQLQEAQKGVQIVNPSDDKFDVNASASTKGSVSFKMNQPTAAGDTTFTLKYMNENGELVTKDITYTADTTATTGAGLTATNLKNAIEADSDLKGLFSVEISNTNEITIMSKASGTGSAHIVGIADSGNNTTVGTITAPTDTGKILEMNPNEKITSGDQITIDGKTYQFMSDTGAAADKGVIKVAIGADNAETLENLQKALEKNGVKADLVKDTNDKTIGLRFTDAPETPATTKTGGLTLQIGDTSDDYNQLTVSIKDMHAESLGLDKVDISTQEGAADAVDMIRNAINQVSDVRGTLGATQNRLDHTINNLSVMEENIQDAESTIRDTDVADEMMAYTKNNILIQSAQAMLAQANQVPQGVLQLLQ